MIHLPPTNRPQGAPPSDPPGFESIPPFARAVGVAVACGFALALRLTRETAATPAGADAPEILRAQLAPIVFGAMVAVGAAGLAAIGYRYWRSRPSPEGPAPAERERDVEVRHPPSSRYEQILAELQGVKLSFIGGEGRAGDGGKNFPKLARLVRVFLARIGVADAANLPVKEFPLRLNGSGLSQRQIQSLMTVVERCEAAERVTNPLKNAVDPLELVRLFKAVVDQLEGRPTDRPATDPEGVRLPPQRGD